MGEPARPDRDRSRDARHHPDGVHPPRREGRRQDRQCRVRQGRERQRSGQGRDEEIAAFSGQLAVLAPVIGVLFDGFAYGMLLFLLSVGLSVTLGMMNFVNLAHCAFAMLGGYVTVTLMNRFGWPFFATLPFAFLLTALVS